MERNYRRCISCRRVALKQEFWRIVRVYPSGELQLDQGMGRSAYLCPQASCLQAAKKIDWGDRFINLYQKHCTKRYRNV